jgi:hypothetical protein
MEAKFLGDGSVWVLLAGESDVQPDALGVDIVGTLVGGFHNGGHHHIVT